jgi:hypothetical protein
VRSPSIALAEISYHDGACTRVASIQWHKESSLSLLFRNIKVTNPATGKDCTFDVIWKASLSRGEVLKVDFLPQHKCAFVNNPHGVVLNMAPGFLIPPDEDFSVDEKLLERLLYHILHVWSQGRKEVSDYILNFFADMVQHPEQKPGVALLLRSQEGAGKTMVFDWIGEFILGDMHLSLSTKKPFTGGFNSIAVNRLLIILNELSWSNDAAFEDLVKTCVTISRGVPGVLLNNCQWIVAKLGGKHLPTG